MCSYVILFRCTVKQTAEVKTLPVACHTTTQQSPSRVSDGQLQHRLLFEHGSFILDFMMLEVWKIELFSTGTFHSEVGPLH